MKQTFAILWLSSLALAACVPAQPQPTPTPAPTVAATSTPKTLTLTDPFAYCAVVGTVDKPDARYIGTPVPDEIINGFKQAAGLESSTEPMDMLRQTTIWRCMDARVYVCNYGANLQCDARADTSQTPTAEMGAFCSANPNSDFIPLSVVGHSSIYSWHCVNTDAQVLDRVDQPDAQGFLQHIWYALTPTP